MHRLCLLALVACGTSSTPKAPPVEEPPLVQTPQAADPVAPRPARAPRIDYDVPKYPMACVVVGDRLVWTDAAGAVWTVPVDGGTPKQLSDQHGVGFVFRPIVVGHEVYASTKRDFVRVRLPDGPVEKLGLTLQEDPEEVVADDHSMYATLFKRDEVMAVSPQPAAAKKLFTFRRGVLAIHAGTLYAISYSTGVLVAIPTSGGTPKQIAKGFTRPTALDVDDTHAYIYTEKDQTIRKVELVTGKTTELAKGLNNSDELVSDGAWLYTYSWPGLLLRIGKQDGAREVLADDLQSPYHIEVDAEAVYVTSRDQHKIVRIAKR